MPFNIYQSNSLEKLADKFIEKYRQNTSSPFYKEIILVQTSGMEKWLSLKATESIGVFANNDFLFPNTLMTKLFKTVLDYKDIKIDFSKEEILWKIYNILPELIHKEEFKQIKNYLSQDNNRLKQYQLSLKIADLFDQYLIYRPEMILAWDNNDFWLGEKTNYNDERFAWQPILWKEIFKESNKHKANILNLFKEKINDEKYITKLKDNFKSINVFGVYILPQIFLDILSIVSQYIDINYFLLNPCKEFWFDIKSRKELKHIERKTGKNLEDLYFDEGNELLSSLGKLGRDFNNMLMNMPNFDNIIEEDYFIDIPENSNLQIIQSDILNLKRIEDIKNENGNFDESIIINSCHNKMREIEILYDNILNYLDKNTDISLSDILVITPDITSYAPYIKAVFDNKTHFLDYRISDIPHNLEYGFLEAFTNIIKFLKGKFKSSEVISLLNYEFIRKNFNIDENDLEQIEKWIDEVGIRWGINISTECNEDFFTFKSGIKRLLLGYSMKSENISEVDSDYIYNNFDESKAVLLGKLLDFLNILFDFSNEIKKEKDIADWANLLQNFINKVFNQSYPFDSSYIFLQKTISEITENADKTSKLTIDVIKSHIWNKFQETDTSNNFLTGGITFSAMIPMRSIPFKIICMIGMNDGTFPRQKQNMEFDLISAFPKLGDRNPRDTDRYLFLETLVSAKEKLYISYIGQNHYDNKEIPPSTLVNELIDYIALRFNIQDKSKLITKHKLQAFNKEYFDKYSNLFSFSKENCELSEKCYQKLEKEKHFFTRLAEKKNFEDYIDFEDLINFYKSPIKYIYNKRLSVYFNENDNFLEDNELFIPDNLNSYLLKEELLSANDKQESEKIINYYKAFSKFPLCNVGEYYKVKYIYENLLKKERIEEYLINHKGIISQEFEITGYNIKVSFKNLYENYQVLIRPGNLSNKFKIEAWLRHLALQKFYDLKTDTIVACEDRIIRFEMIENPDEYLEKFVSNYIEGFSKPLKFIPKFSFKSDINKQKQIISNWFNEEFDGNADPYLNHCFEGNAPIDEEFFDISESLTKDIKEEVIWKK
jgi:exodeoxyribonuclease V gamma subunit